MGAMYATNIILLIIFFVGSIGIYLFGWDSTKALGVFFGCGLTAIYDIKLKEFNDNENGTNGVGHVPIDQQNVGSVPDSENDAIEKTMPRLVKIENVRDANQWDNVDRQQS